VSRLPKPQDQRGGALILPPTNVCQALESLPRRPRWRKQKICWGEKKFSSTEVLSAHPGSETGTVRRTGEGNGPVPPIMGRGPARRGS